MSVAPEHVALGVAVSATLTATFTDTNHPYSSGLFALGFIMVGAWLVLLISNYFRGDR